MYDHIMKMFLFWQWMHVMRLRIFDCLPSSLCYSGRCNLEWKLSSYFTVIQSYMRLALFCTASFTTAAVARNKYGVVIFAYSDSRLRQLSMTGHQWNTHRLTGLTSCHAVLIPTSLFTRPWHAYLPTSHSSCWPCHDFRSTFASWVPAYTGCYPHYR